MRDVKSGPGDEFLLFISHDHAICCTFRSNHKTRIRTNLPAHKILNNKKKQGFIGIKKIMKTVKRKMKSKLPAQRKKRWEKLEAMEKYQIFSKTANIS